MPRPRHDNPTPAELEILQVIWDRGPSTVREVMSVLHADRPRAYTSVMSLMNVMVEKGLLRSKLEGRAALYTPKVSQENIRSRMVNDLLDRVFEGSTRALVLNLLEQTEADPAEMEEVRKAIAEFRQKKGNPS